MTVPEQLEEEPVDVWRENTWGVPRDAEAPKRSPVAYLVWIVLTVIIILSLVLPYILPYFTPRRVPVRDGLQANLTTEIGGAVAPLEHTEIFKNIFSP